MHRRAVLRALGMASGYALVAREARAQRGIIDTSNFAVMDQSAALPVRLPAKPSPGPVLRDEQVNELERSLRCPCGCTLDVYTCRTTDFICQVSPAVHRDVLALVRGGYSETEIRDAFRAVYGERILMSPMAQRFNLLAYLTPPLALLAGVIALTARLRGRRRTT